MAVYAFEGRWPKLAADCFVAPTASVIGDVEIGEGSSIWFGAVLRGDVHYIRIGSRVNIQDNAIVHVTGGLNPTIVHDDVTVGHGAILHGCTVESDTMIGMGAIVLDRAVIGRGALIGAGSLVTEGTVIEPWTLAFGRPARPIRPLTEEEKQRLAVSPPHYAELAQSYAADLGIGHKKTD